MINAIVAFKKAVADIGFKKAVASIRIGEFLIFRFFFEVLGLSDAQAKDVGKSLSDSQAITDLAAQSVGKPLSDSSGTSDSAVLGFGTVQNDSGATSDQIDTFATGKALQDTSFASENQTMDFHKFIDELAGVTDDLDGEASAEDDQEMTFTKVTSDLSTLSDSFAYSSMSAVSDTIGPNDTGSLRSQGYCAFDYFSEDYVGASRTF
tara:strand:+ start:170 stop:790 length:621 start_codon:yes stop_codon:yes gene_type:complete